jgi:hypothetical protein
MSALSSPFSLYELNEAQIEQILPEKVKIVCLRPASKEFSAVDTTQPERYSLLNSFAKRLRKNKEHPLIADVHESDVVILPQDEIEAKQMMRRGLDRHGLLPADPAEKDVSIHTSIYRRLLLRAIEISLRKKGYIVRESHALKYVYLTTSYAYMYSTGLSANNKYFEIFRGCAFRLLVYPQDGRAGLIIDPTFRFIPRATLSEMIQHKDSIQDYGGLKTDDGIHFEGGLRVMDVCPIKPEICPYRKSPYESDCLLYNERLDSAVSWPKYCTLQSVPNKNVGQYPIIRKSLKNCNIINEYIKDDSLVGEVSFRGSKNIYCYPLQRLRRIFEIARIPYFVRSLGGTDQDVTEMNKFFEKETKLPPNERRWYSNLFVRDFGDIHFGPYLLNLKKSLTQGVVRPWKKRM